MTVETPKLWTPTPLIYSSHLSRRIQDFYEVKTNSSWKNKKISVYLKLELLHPPHSFKHRGISLFAYRALEKYGKDVHLVIASGGNAGYAAACAARNLGIRCTVYLPNGAAPSTIKVLEEQYAEVVVIGRFYAEAVEKAKETVSKEEKAVLVPAYEDPIIWEGHSSMIEEIAEQLPPSKKPTSIFCSVGGGGMLGGIMEGCRKVGWEDVTITALETIGSNCFHHSVLLNTPSASSEFATDLPPYVERLSVSLPNDSASPTSTNLTVAHFTSFHSLASGSLGASTPSPGVLQTALNRHGPVKSVSVEDETAMVAALGLADDHKSLVELACATTLVPAYFPELLEKLALGEEEEELVLVFIVCGGFKVSSNDIPFWKKSIAESKEKQEWKGWKVVMGDGNEIFVRD
ncbi:tryptophan synthase beta subunit-like PLP-dependent enzyme [Dendrothele bispora CBS 962.96]|uniref:L-serine ammonia-lyase n=1 Tax=Dendrothele bispora (strain CBS 962.96) TaxID=1314807 RepID=A0A4S8M0E4_DENBC|nr:tryptophan synthase beta subunit-like PLP-dependent enzyme [Dendrothele bispora CBS 962.96]